MLISFKWCTASFSAMLMAIWDMKGEDADEQGCKALALFQYSHPVKHRYTEFRFKSHHEDP